MGDKQNAARVAWAAIKLSQVGQCPASLDQLATQPVRFFHAEARRLVDRLEGTTPVTPLP